MTDDDDLFVVREPRGLLIERILWFICGVLLIAVIATLVLRALL